MHFSAPAPHLPQKLFNGFCPQLWLWLNLSTSNCLCFERNSRYMQHLGALTVKSLWFPYGASGNGLVPGNRTHLETDTPVGLGRTSLDYPDLSLDWRILKTILKTFQNNFTQAHTKREASMRTQERKTSIVVWFLPKTKVHNPYKRFYML